MQSLSTGFYPSPIGILKIAYTANGISSLVFLEDENKQRSDDLFLQSCFMQLDMYFSGEKMSFDLPLDLDGTQFQKKVWHLIQTIPYGRSATYSGLARKLGNPHFARAIGQANARNPVSLIVPCHRVTGLSGDLTGYAGGLWRKRWLLEHEGWDQTLRLF
jgi:methylated-DNA-[protein]-cysteine S-methyltransferase